MRLHLQPDHLNGPPAKLDLKGHGDPLAEGIMVLTGAVLFAVFWAEYTAGQLGWALLFFALGAGSMVPLLLYLPTKRVVADETGIQYYRSGKLRNEVEWGSVIDLENQHHGTTCTVVLQTRDRRAMRFTSHHLDNKQLRMLFQFMVNACSDHEIDLFDRNRWADPWTGLADPA